MNASKETGSADALALANSAGPTFAKTTYLVVALVRNGQMSASGAEAAEADAKPARASEELLQARSLVARGEAAGGILCAWSGASLAFAVEPSALDAAIDLAVYAAEVAPNAWAIAIAEGPLAIEPTSLRPRLAAGRALTRALELASIARAGEALLDHRVGALTQGEIHRLGWRFGRNAKGRRLRGAILDVAKPWIRDQAPLARDHHFVESPIFGREDPSTLLAMPGAVAVVRANPGLGGSRMMAEVRAAAGSSFSLLLTPTVTNLQPLGAVRNAMLRALAEGEAEEIEPELVPARERLLQGEGITLESAATVIAGHLLRAGREPGVLLIDDAAEIDGSSLEACARAMQIASFPAVVRLDATSPLPHVFAELPRGPEMDLGPLSSQDAERLAAACTNGSLDREGQVRWARLGGNTPLGVQASLRAALAQNELTWTGGRAYPRKSTSGKGQVMHPSYWIARCAALASMPAQCVLAVVTLAGGEVAVHDVERALEATGAPVVARVEIESMIQSGWLVESAPGWIALPTRTHRDAILGELMDEETRHATHAALAASLGATERGLGLADVAFHAARAGDGPRAARLALAAAGTATVMGLASGAADLIALARREDPNCEIEAQRQLATSVASGRVARTSDPGGARSSAPSIRASKRVSLPPQTEPEPEEEWEDDAPTIGPTPVHGIPQVILPVESVGKRLSWLAKEALVSADSAALEQWTAGLRATGDHSRYAERLQALARLRRGEVGDALRVLRSARAELEGQSGPLRTQASLALAVALAGSGRLDEALLEALDGLARARLDNDPQGSLACLAFLSKLYVSAGRTPAATEIREALQRAGSIA